jgi:hypothetical protein
MPKVVGKKSGLNHVMQTASVGWTQQIICSLVFYSFHMSLSVEERALIGHNHRGHIIDACSWLEKYIETFI